MAGGHSSAGRALAWHARGRRFDPAWLHHPLLAHRADFRSAQAMRCLKTGSIGSLQKCTSLLGPRHRRDGACGCSSGVEHNLAKVGVEGSNPFARSISTGIHRQGALGRLSSFRCLLKQTGPFQGWKGPRWLWGHTSLTFIRLNRCFNPDCRAERCLQCSTWPCGGSCQPRRRSYVSLHPFKPGRVPGSSSGEIGFRQEPASLSAPIRPFRRAILED
jgi:hypothetical protein